MALQVLKAVPAFSLSMCLLHQLNKFSKKYQDTLFLKIEQHINKAQVFNLSAGEAEAGMDLWVQGQPVLHNTLSQINK